MRGLRLMRVVALLSLAAVFSEPLNAQDTTADKTFFTRRDALMAEAQKASGQATKKQTVEQALRLMIKLPMKIKRQCGRCGDFNSVLVEPGAAAPAFKYSSCGYPAA